MNPIEDYRPFITKIRTVFNDGTYFEGNEVQNALVCGFTAKARGGVNRVDVIEEDRLRFCHIVIKSGSMVYFVPKTGEETKLTRDLEITDAVWGVNSGPGWVFNFNDGQPRAYTLDINNCEEIYP